VQGALTSESEVMPMKNKFDFKDLMTFGLFILALLTFVFTFCKKFYVLIHGKTTLNLTGTGGFFYHIILVSRTLRRLPF